MTEQRKAVALISGGLDSMLAARVVQKQGVHVEGLNFYTGFCVEGHTHAIRQQDGAKPKRNNALWVAEQLGIKLHIIDVIDEYKDVVLNPKHGYGSHLNPCLDCKIFMVRKALAWSFMEEHGFDFIITGEVMGQRPKSQRKQTLPLIARESGADDRLLRPLCAKHLPETLPEREGWVDREKLHAFHGRNRKPQLALAQEFGFTEWAQPAGGCCFLTNPHYSAKLRDLWSAQGRRDYDFDDIMLLKVGRHLRPAPSFKLILGREDGENRYLEGYRKRFMTLRLVDRLGPLCLVDGAPAPDQVALAGRILARYSQGRDEPSVRISVERPDGTGEVLDVAPLPPQDVRAEWRV
jgi:tRNA-uridine 2-sulfurtransferase